MFNLLHAGTYLYCGERVAVGAAGRQPAHADRDTNDGMDDALRATCFQGVTAGGRRGRRGYNGNSQMRLFRRWRRSCSSRDLCGFLSSRGPRSQMASRAA